MNTDLAHPAELAALRAAFEADAPLGWDRVHAFEAEHGIVLPEPYRTFVAEISDGSYTGPPDYGLMPLAEQPDDGREADGERCLAEPFPLTEAWVWEEDDRPEEELEPLLDQVFGHGSIVLGTDGCGMDWHLVVTGPHPSSSEGIPAFRRGGNPVLNPAARSAAVSLRSASPAEPCSVGPLLVLDVVLDHVEGCAGA
ncbi:SMI1/KNR4 family protein [Streptomyces sp. NBC_01320]|uniref:SMI1/KNR4 family protein n=1 Tax=Streptomyces sp. NBC_01320 TaxID=2903824 RepID=UPI003FA35D97